MPPKKSLAMVLTGAKKSGAWICRHRDIARRGLRHLRRHYEQYEGVLNVPVKVAEQRSLA